MAQSGTGTLSLPPLPERLGTNSRFILDPAAPGSENGVIKLRNLSGRTLIGYLYGGMRTHDENPTGSGQSFASNRLFNIFATPAPTACIAVPRSPSRQARLDKIHGKVSGAVTRPESPGL